VTTLEWAHWFNHHWLFEPIGCIPPTGARANYERTFASQVTKPAI
jgi:hypothetical protein